MKNLLNRRSIRKYADQEVEQQLLNRLMTEAARTQTMGLSDGAYQPRTK